MEKIEFKLGFSYQLCLLFLVLYGASIFIIFWLPILFFFKILGITLIIFSFCRLWKLHISRSAKNSTVRIWQDPKGRWGIESKEGHTAYGQLLGDSYKGIFLLILRFKLPARSIRVLVPRDALPASYYQILCSRLDFS